MAENRESIERVVDEVWLRALREFVLRDETLEDLRSGFDGEFKNEIDLAIPQMTTSSLMIDNPAFAGLLYTSGYTSAKRNAYLLTRRLPGRRSMPPDYFWKFEYCQKEEARKRLEGVIGNIFAPIITGQKDGYLTLVDLDPEESWFELQLAYCAECSGLNTGRAICFFHAGLFAGILGDLLDQDMDAVELKCVAQGDEACVFKIAKRRDAPISIPLIEDLNWESLPEHYLPDLVEQSLGGHADRELGANVHLGYYQLLLSSLFMIHRDVLEKACVEAGEALGRALKPHIDQLMADRGLRDRGEAISSFYREHGYADIYIPKSEPEQAVDVQVREAPEAIGPLAPASLTPFVLCGMLQVLLSGDSSNPWVHQLKGRNGTTILLEFAPRPAQSPP